MIMLMLVNNGFKEIFKAMAVKKTKKVAEVVPDSISLDDRASTFIKRADTLAKSFEHIKKDPMNLNLVMTHIGFLSMTVDELLRDYVENVLKKGF